MHICNDLDKQIYVDDAEYSKTTEIEYEKRCEIDGVCFCPDTYDELNLYMDKGLTMVEFTKCGTINDNKKCAPESV